MTGQAILEIDHQLEKLEFVLAIPQINFDHIRSKNRLH